MMLCRNIDEVRNTLYQQENGFLLGRARFVNDENGSLGLSEKYVFVQCAVCSVRVRRPYCRGPCGLRCLVGRTGESKQDFRQ